MLRKLISGPQAMLFSKKEQIRMGIVALGSIAVPSILRKARRLCGIFLYRSPYKHKHCR